MKNLSDAIGLAVQIAYEYPGFGSEHISEMLDTYEASGETPPCTYNELEDLCAKARVHQQNEIPYSDACDLMEKENK